MKLKNPKPLRWTALSTGLLLAAAGAIAAEPATLSVGKLKGLDVKLYGFVETDLISDSRQGFTEEQGNNLVPRPAPGGVDSFAGKHGRTELTVRNSRLGFDLTLPKASSGLSMEGVLELDMLGNNGTNAVPGSMPGTQTERDFFNNPAVRVRHALINLTYNDWNAKIGQTWSLLGWQPYYFPSEVIVQPAVGQLYRRFAQARATYSHPFGGALLEAAADLAKPAEMNSALPEAHAGLRLSSTKTKAAVVGGAGSSMTGFSAGVSGAWIPVRTDIGNDEGQALALDVFLPLLASKDGQDRSNNLSLTAELMAGSGVGGLEYSGLSFGVPGVTAASGGAAKSGTAVDSGIAGINADGNLELIRARAERVNLSYTLPCPQWTLSAGYAEVDALNLDRFSNAFNGNASGTGFAPKMQFGYLSVFYDATAALRLAAELNQTLDTYNDAANRYAINNRIQLSSYFIF